MRQVDLFNIHYQPCARPAGGIVSQYFVGGADRLSARFADMRALESIWRYPWEGMDIIGFQGYRKHINFRDDTKGWRQVPLPEFTAYQDWLYKWDGKLVRDLLMEHDIIVTDAFDVRFDGDITGNFRRSRSPHDWLMLEHVVAQHGLKFDFHMPDVTSYFFVTTLPVFQSYMKIWWPVFRDLEPLVTAEDAHDGAYKALPLAYLSEFFFSMWLNQSGLKKKIMPLMICWDAR